jgi:glycosyltransferase involved in cell wall biosynthesis
VVRFDTVSPEGFAAAEQVWVPHRAGGERLALAAMAAGRPVLAAETPELREAVGDAGRFFAPGDRAGLAALARKLLLDPSAAQALGAAGKRRAIERFPAWRLADPLAAVYHEAGVPPARS